MRWLEHIYHPLVAYPPIIRDILVRPWLFMRKVVEDDEHFSEKLRHCSFFLTSIYLIIQPYLLPKKISVEPESLVQHFEEAILMLVIIAAFSVVFLIVERKNKDLTLDTFLNVVIPVLLVAVFLSTATEFITQSYLETLGLSRLQIYVSCRGVFDYRCLGQFNPQNSTSMYRFALASSLLEGHLKAVLVACYIVGLDPLRSRKKVPVDSKAGRVGIVIFIYLLAQLVVLNANGLLRK